MKKINNKDGKQIVGNAIALRGRYLDPTKVDYLTDFMTDKCQIVSIGFNAVRELPIDFTPFENTEFGLKSRLNKPSEVVGKTIKYASEKLGGNGFRKEYDFFTKQLPKKGFRIDVTSLVIRDVASGYEARFAPENGMPGPSSEGKRKMKTFSLQKVSGKSRIGLPSDILPQIQGMFKPDQWARCALTKPPPKDPKVSCVVPT